mgnify:CR=1 FL=1|jgi:hypothetical protein
MIEETKEAWTKYLTAYTWEWFVTMRFEPGTTPQHAEHVLKLWSKRLKEKERLKIAGIAVFNNAEPMVPHLHCLLTEHEAPFTRSLRNVDISAWEMKESAPGLALASMVIVPARGWTEAAALYVTKEKNLALHRPDHWTLITIRPRLLERLGMAA